jgi:PAS domain S-box-containing protein
MERSGAREAGAPVAGADSRGGEAPPSTPAVHHWAAEGGLRPDSARDIIRRGEELFRGVFDKAAVGLALVDLEGHIIDANPALQDMLGYAVEELRRMDYSDFVHQDDLPDVKALLDNIRRGRARQMRRVARYIRKGWEMRWGRVTGSLMSGREGGPPLIVAALENITEQVLTEQSLRTSFATYRDLVDNTAAGVATADIDGRITFANRALCALSGYSEDELLGRLFSEFIPPEDLDKMLERFGAVFNWQREEPALEFRLVRKDGRVAHCYTSPQVIYCDGDADGFSAIIQDITARKKAEEELVKLSSAVKMTRESILILDSEGSVTFSNGAAAALVRPGRPAGAGWKLSDHVPPSGKERWRLVLSETLRRGGVRDAELELDAGQGRVVPIEISTTAMAGDGGRPAGIVAVLRDVTERKLVERQLRSKLMAFRLDEGGVYLVKESTPITSMEGFFDLLRAGYRGTVLSRTPQSESAPDSKEAFSRIWLSEKSAPGSMQPGTENILSWLEDRPRNHAVLLDRLDYLISRNGFRDVLGMVQRLREAAYLGGHIVILSLDPATLDAVKLRAFEKESAEMLPTNRHHLPPEELEIVRYVFESSISGERPTLTEVGRALGLCKPTARKHVRDAVRDGYVTLIQRGRTKVLEPTEKGRSVFSKRGTEEIPRNGAPL